jgi:uncharacterized RDD family membrane protein YckC
MLNNIGLPGLILLSPMLIAMVMGVYSLAKVPSYDDKFNYAGFWLRFVAALIDGILMTLITLIPAITLGYWVGINMAGTSSAYEIEATAQALGNLLGFVVGWLYYTLLESSKYQATFGKKLLGLRVVDLDGNRIGFGKANGRYFGKLLSVFTLLIGHFMMGWTKRKQSLYDKLAGCLVVRNTSPALALTDESVFFEISNLKKSRKFIFLILTLIVFAPPLLGVVLGYSNIGEVLFLVFGFGFLQILLITILFVAVVKWRMFYTAICIPLVSSFLAWFVFAVPISLNTLSPLYLMQSLMSLFF